MAQQYVSINIGKDGFKMSEFTTGTSSTAGDDFEFRFNDAATGITKKDVHNAIKAIERFFMNKDQSTNPKL